MSIWKITGGLKWKSGVLCRNELFTIEVEKEESREIVLEKDDVLIPGFYDGHCHLWGQKDTFGKGALIALSPEHMMADGVVGCADAGSYGYADWENADRLWRISRLPVKSWINILPEGLTRAKRSAPEDIDVERLVALYKKYEDRVLGFKLMHGLAPDRPGWERGWLAVARHVADRTGARLMVHLTGSILPIGETIAALRKGDILSHIYNAAGPGGTIVGSDGRILPEVFEAGNKGILLEMSSAFRHFSFPVYRKAHEAGLEPDIIATDNNLRDYGRPPLTDIAALVSKMIAAGMDRAKALSAAIDTPRRVMGFEEHDGGNAVVLRYIRKKTMFQDIALEEPAPVLLEADGYYRPSHGILNHQCVFVRTTSC